MEMARASTIVTQALGTPIDDGYFTTGSIHVSGPSGSAELAIPISGPKGKGTIFLRARKSVGEWSFTKLVFAAQGNQRTDLMAKPDDASNSTTGANWR
jgi:hypothetical protein